MKYWSGIKMVNKEILDFYKQTSCFTDLGYYKEFAKSLPDDIEKLCALQRMQIIHPVILQESYDEKEDKDAWIWGDIKNIPPTRLIYEEDYFPTAQSIIAELLRKNPNYNIQREAKDKVHITCRGQAILLASILKAKGISARARSGFAGYIKNDGTYWDHWITEYFDENEVRWKLVDADEHCPGENLDDVPFEKYLFGAEAWLGLRNEKYKEKQILYASEPVTLGLKAAIRGLFYDFHALMNNEIIFLHLPRYITQKDYELTEEELKELDELATLMLNPNNNFEKLQEIWKTKTKFRILQGALNY